MASLRIGTRSSELALWQARYVAGLIAQQPGAPAVELVHIKTEGDLRTDVPLWSVGGRAFFTKEIDRALLANEIDIAVHSLKDLSTTVETGLTLAAVLEREDSRDALLSTKGTSVGDLPKGARVGTSSLRRRAFFARARPDATLLELRGNVPTRVERLHEGRYDAIILAVAGLKRLGLDSHITAYLDSQAFPSAVSQGAVGVCARLEDAASLKWLQALDHYATRVATTAERALLRRIEGGCQVPLGAVATLQQDTLRMHSTVCALNGSEFVDASGSIAIAQTRDAALQSATTLGEQLADKLVAQGADRLIAERRAPQ